MDSSYNLNVENLSTPNCSRRNSLNTPGKTSCKEIKYTPSELSIGLPNSQDDDVFDDVDLQKNSMESISIRNEDLWNTMENIAGLGLSFQNDDTEISSPPKFERFSLDDTKDFGTQPYESKRPFNKWAKNLEQRVTRRRKTISCDTNMSAQNADLFESPGTQRKFAHNKSSSGSSFGFVSAVKSASISLASISVGTKSKRTVVSSRQQRTDRSSKASNPVRTSDDSTCITGDNIIDQAVTKRSLQRRRVLEEMISTEENYVADVKFLTNVYVTILASMPSLCSNLRASITRNLNEILELHEELLGDLHQAVPHSEYTQSNCAKTPLPKINGHHRWRSLDAVPENSTGSWLQEIPGMTADPKVAAEVARVFGKRMNRLFIYEEYGAKYEMMIKDVGSTHRTIPQWKDFQKGLEALALSLASINYQQDSSKKAMTIGDLLVKPIQRICRYQLLFAELLKQTPVCDCPDSHMDIETVMIRLREATTEINRATDDPQMKTIIEKSWLLQDRISFPDMSDAQSKNLIRSLGHINLCGVLHVSWQTQNGVDGQYLVCLLYRDYFLLASTPKYDQEYLVQASIGLSGLAIEEVDNGRGLQCHTAQFSWKLVFEGDHQLFELTMSACSPKEEQEWRRRLTSYSCREGHDTGEPILYSSISLPVKPLGTIFGKPGTIARRISVHRATTVGQMSGLCQVIIKNTNIFRDTPSSVAINRSQSLLTTNRIPVLAPSRAERSRLEALLSDVWSRQILPYPGMTHRARSEQIVRASASSMMRKLSVASIASNFTKQSTSVVSLQKATGDDESSKSVTPNLPSTHFDNNSESKSSEIEGVSRSRLSMIPDEKENVSHRDSLENAATVISALNSSPAGSMRMDNLRSRKRRINDNHGIITPSICSPSINSTNLYKLLTIPISAQKSDDLARNVVKDDLTSTAARDDELNQPHWKDCKSYKVNNRGISLVTEGIRNFFR